MSYHKGLILLGLEMSSANTGGQTFHSVQYLRGFAALAVFLFHISGFTVAAWGDSAAVIDHVGAAGVDLFFVISGFIMAMIVARPGAFDTRDFILRRVARVIPGYYMATIGVFALAIIAPSAMASTGADIAKLVRSLAFVPWADHEGSMAPLLLVGWTLNYEIFFYVLVALAAGLFGDRRLFIASGFIFGLVLGGWVMAPEHPTIAFYSDPILLEFVFGIVVWHLYQRFSSMNLDQLSFFLFMGGILLLAVQREHDPGNFRTLFWGVPAAMIVFGAFRVMSFQSRFLEGLGDISYAFYLTHLFVIAAYIRVIMPHMPHPSSAWPVHYTAILSMALISAWLFHVLVEKPAGRLVLALLQRQRLPSTGNGKPA